MNLKFKQFSGAYAMHLDRENKDTIYALNKKRQPDTFEPYILKQLLLQLDYKVLKSQAFEFIQSFSHNGYVFIHLQIAKHKELHTKYIQHTNRWTQRIECAMCIAV